ncbi:MAG: peptidyl-prolyl cis-trans isomerase [Rhodospirillales bacterium]|nr:peptidyl-prolyl cis-trans isomerase [Rhodospirillales bacterium]
MLNALRKRSKSVLTYGLFGLLILSFMTWGIGDWITGRPSYSAVAEVGDVEISPEHLNREYVSQINRLEQMFGTRLDREQARAMGLLQAALSSLVNNALYDQGVATLGGTASDAVIRANIQSDRGFMDQTGRFNRTQFEQALLANGYNEQTYVMALRRQIARDQLVDSVDAGLAVPKSMIEQVYRHRQEKRIAETLLITDESMTGIAEPTDEQIIAYHSENPDEFTAPEYRKLTVLNLQAADLVSEIAVSDEEIRDLYDQRQDEFDKPEMRTLRQIVVQEEEKAKEAHRLISEGRDFAEVAKEVADMDAPTTEIGEVGRSMLLAELAEAAFSTPENAISEPVQSPLGWHVIRVDAIAAAHRQSVDDVREQLSLGVAHEKSIDALFELANQVEDLLGGGATLEEASSQLNLPIQTIEAIDAAGRDPAGNEVQDLPPGNRFLQTAFDTPETEDSLMTDAGSDGYFLLRVDEVTPSAVRPLDEVRSAAIEAWKADQRAEKAKATADAMVQRLADGEAFTGLAAETGAEIKTTGGFTRLTAPPSSGLTPAIVQQIFGVRTGEAVAGRTQGGYMVARLTEIVPASPGGDSEGLAAIQRSLTDAMRADVQAQFATALGQDFPIQINQQAIEQIF